MPNLNAAIGCSQIIKLPDFIKSKRNLFLKYKKAFASLTSVKLFTEPIHTKSNYWLQTLILEKSYENQMENILEYTNNEGLMTRPAWELMHRSKMYRNCPRAPLPIAESLVKRIINIPSSAFI